MLILFRFRRVFVRLPWPRPAIFDTSIETRMKNEKAWFKRKRAFRKGGVAAFDDPVLIRIAKCADISPRFISVTTHSDFSGLPGDGIKIQDGGSGFCGKPSC